MFDYRFWVTFPYIIPFFPEFFTALIIIFWKIYLFLIGG